MKSLRTGYIYHELFGWHDTGTQAGMFPTDPSRGLQPFINYENAETKRRSHFFNRLKTGIERNEWKRNGGLWIG